MSVEAVLETVSQMSVDDRIRLVHAIWDGIPRDEIPVPELSDEVKEKLSSRMADLRRNPDDVLTWEQIETRVRNRPVLRSRYTLSELLDGMTDDQIHPETPTGVAVGREVL